MFGIYKLMVCLAQMHINFSYEYDIELDIHFMRGAHWFASADANDADCISIAEYDGTTIGKMYDLLHAEEALHIVCNIEWNS